MTSEYAIILKKNPYGKGEMPEHLKPYAGQIKDCPVKCKGKTGQTYASCLRKCAAKVKKKK